MHPIAMCYTHTDTWPQHGNSRQTHSRDRSTTGHDSTTAVCERTTSVHSWGTRSAPCGSPCND
eukprot:839158-Prymnesium_polylepis.1